MQEQSDAVPFVKMLLVDDDSDFATIFQISLRADKWGSFEIETANTLEAALKILREKSFQLILLDLGLTANRGLWDWRSSDILRKITGKITSSPELCDHFCKKFGADEYLEKPVDPKTL